MASPVLKPISLIEFIKDSLLAGGFSVSNSEIVSNLSVIETEDFSNNVKLS